MSMVHCYTCCQDRMQNACVLVTLGTWSPESDFCVSRKHIQEKKKIFYKLVHKLQRNLGVTHRTFSFFGAHLQIELQVKILFKQAYASIDNLIKLCLMQVYKYSGQLNLHPLKICERDSGLDSLR